MGRLADIEDVKVNEREWANMKFVSCDTCANGIVTKDGIRCGKNIAGKCKPNLLEKPKFYVNWLEDSKR